MGHLPSPKANGDLDLVAFLEEPLDRLALEDQIVLVSRGAHAHLFEKGNLLIAPGITLLLLLLELVSAVIEKATNRGNSGRGNLDQIEIMLLGKPQGLVKGENAELLTVFADDSDLAGANAFVNAQISANRYPPLRGLHTPP